MSSSRVWLSLLAGFVAIQFAGMLSAGPFSREKPMAGRKAEQKSKPQQTADLRKDPIEKPVVRASDNLLPPSPDAHVPPSPDTISTSSPSDGSDVSKAAADVKGAVSASKKLDPAMIASGSSAFTARCIQCHDAQKALSKSKSLGGWRGTVQRMARMDGAEIPANEIEPIAVYLTSLNPAVASGDDKATADSGDASGNSDSPITVFGTLSPTWRGGNAEIQNPGFFSDVWVGAAMDQGVISARVTACISCHNEHDEGYLSRIELVEATLQLDIGKYLRGSRPASSCQRNVEAIVEAGRFVVPFGAYSAQVNPGVYRSVSRPLIFNMGQRVRGEQLGDPVLPMPYSDEGANLSLSIPVFDDLTATMTSYVVNGLQGGGDGINFDDSREYTDNNKTPAVGGRWTFGNQMLRFGASAIGGRFNDNAGSGAGNRGLNFSIFGADATFRYKDIVRLQTEFAQRNTAVVLGLPGQEYGSNRVAGCYAEGELLMSRRYRLSLFGRYDQQTQNYATGSPLARPVFDVNRLTYGVNWTLKGGSLLMVNLEHWYMPREFKDINVLGARWAMSF